MKTYDLVIPALKKDLNVFYQNKLLYFKNLHFNKIIIITKDIEISNDNLFYLDENTLYPNLTYKNVYEKILSLGGSPERTGWYFQQFLKMAYAFNCSNEYYLVWDVDTVPIKNIKMFKNNKPVFHMKNEYHKPYFITLDKLTNGEIVKKTKKSFISEHMLINTKIMRELVSYFKNINNKYEFWENILDSINLSDLSYSGFSEFESYGNYVLTYYPNMYIMKNYNSCRLACRLFGPSPTNDDIKWAKKSFSAISLEKYDIISKYSYLWKSKIFRFFFPCKFIYYLYLKVSNMKENK